MTARRTWWLASTVVAVLIYAVMWLGYRAQWAWLHWVDFDAVTPVHRYAAAHPGWVTLWNVVCAVFSPEGFRVLGALVVVAAVLQRNVRAAVFLLACIGLSGVLGSAAKELADRTRPADALAATASSSFPSTHAVAAMAGVLALLAVARWPRVAAGAGAVIVAAVGFGRVTLAAHYPSDVLAGWALGYLWFLLCLALFRPPPLKAHGRVGFPGAERRPNRNKRGDNAVL